MKKKIRFDNSDMVNDDDYIRGGSQKEHYSEEDTEKVPCPFCAGNDFVILDSEKGLGVVQCAHCNLIYTNPRPKNAEQNYFGEESVFYNEAALIFKGKRKHHRDKNFEYEIGKIRKHKAGGTLLDIGPGMGFFLRIARKAGFETEGVEPSPALAKIASEQWGMKIHNGYLQQVDLPENHYDVITMIDVFEHVTAPKEVLNKCIRLLKEDGILAIKVPNGDYNLTKMKIAKILKSTGNKDIWDCYEHVIHYTPTTFKKMAEACGLNIIQWFVPRPIHPPVWAELVGHYYQYSSPFFLDWKKRTMRSFFYGIGKMERVFSKKVRFGPDLMFIVRKREN